MLQRTSDAVLCIHSPSQRVGAGGGFGSHVFIECQKSSPYIEHDGHTIESPMSVAEPQPRFRPLSRHFWIALAIGAALVFTLFGTFVVSTDCNGVTQALNMRKARRHIEAILPAVLGVRGREHVTMSEYTGGPCGSMIVRGTIASREEAELLRSDIAATKPPVAVLFHLSTGDFGSPMFEIDSLPASK